MLLLKTIFYCKIFPINLPKLTTSKTLQQPVLKNLRLLSVKLYTNPLKFHISRRLVLVKGSNLASR